MIRRVFVILTFSVWLLQLPLAAREMSEDELRMKERLVALSEGNGSVTDLRIELMEGSMVAHRSYVVADGKIVRREWDSPGSPEQNDEWTVTDDAVRALLRDLVEEQYWTFEGTRFIPDNTVFLFRFYYKDLQYVDYRCDVDEYELSQPRLAIRSVFLEFCFSELAGRGAVNRLHHSRTARSSRVGRSSSCSPTDRRPRRGRRYVSSRTRLRGPRILRGP